MDSFLIKKLFNNLEYYENKHTYGNFVLDKMLMKNIKIPKKIDREVALKELIEIKFVFEKNNVDFFLTHGSCLGIIRDNNFIEYDSDIDIGCYKKDIKNIILVVLELREKYNYKITKISQDDESIAIIKNNVIIDISLYKRDKLVWKANRHKIFEIPHRFLDTLEEIEFLGIKINVPCCVEEYLKYQYGDDWKTPIKDFYSPYRCKIELPIIGVLKYIIGKSWAEKFAKLISKIVKKIRER